MASSDVQGRFGRRVKDLRRERGLSQADVAERAELTPEYVSRIERGLVSPSMQTLEGLARGLGVELAELFAFGASRAPVDASLVQLMDLARQGTPDERKLLVRLAEAVVRQRRPRR